MSYSTPLISLNNSILSHTQVGDILEGGIRIIFTRALQLKSEFIRLKSTYLYNHHQQC